jgi:CRISPR-associated protein Cas2
VILIASAIEEMTMPARARMHYIIAYDVTDDGKRTKLANLLLGYGERVQKSVFEADLEPSEVQEILKLAANYISGTDNLRLYPQCRACASRGSSIGILPTGLADDFWIV